MIRLALVCLITVFVTSPLIYSQSVVLLKGLVRSNDAGARVDLTFKDETGKLTHSKSATDGSYQAVLKSGHHYTVTVLDENLVSYNFMYDVPASSKYVELTKDFPLAVKQAEPVRKPVVTKAKAKKKYKRKKSIKGKTK